MVYVYAFWNLVVSFFVSSLVIQAVSKILQLQVYVQAIFCARSESLCISQSVFSKCRCKRTRFQSHTVNQGRVSTGERKRLKHSEVQCAEIGVCHPQVNYLSDFHSRVPKLVFEAGLDATRRPNCRVMFGTRLCPNHGPDASNLLSAT